MLKKHQQRNMSQEQRERIERLPGVVVHTRERKAGDTFFKPAFETRETMQITASELIDRELDEWSEE